MKERNEIKRIVELGWNYDKGFVIDFINDLQKEIYNQALDDAYNVIWDTHPISVQLQAVNPENIKKLKIK